MAITTFNRLPLEKQLLIVKRSKHLANDIQGIVSELVKSDPIIVFWNNGRIKILS